MKKHKGSILDFLPSLMVFLAFLIIVLVVINSLKLVSYRQDIRAVARGYILEMETVGYLTSESEVSLMQALTDLGAENVDLLNTTMIPAGYGKPIVLQIKCEVRAESLNMSAGDMLQFFFGDTIYTIEINMKSTAKY